MLKKFFKKIRSSKLLCATISAVIPGALIPVVMMLMCKFAGFEGWPVDAGWLFGFCLGTFLSLLSDDLYDLLRGPAARSDEND